jgi:hypothetical protein
MMVDQKVERDGWRAFFDIVSRALGGRSVEIEVVGLDVGDQLEGDAMALNGITYDHSDGSIDIYLLKPNALAHMARRVGSPRDVYIQVDGTGLLRIVIVDHEGHEVLVHFRAPLLLPASTRDNGSERSAAGEQSSSRSPASVDAAKR